MATLERAIGGGTPMKAGFANRSRSGGRATHPVIYGLLAFMSVAGSISAAQPDVGFVAAVVKGKDTLLLKAYGKSEAEGDAPMSVDTILQGRRAAELRGHRFSRD